MEKDFTRPETLTREEYLLELKKDYHNKDLFHKLSNCTQITIIQRIDDIERQIEEETEKFRNEAHCQGDEFDYFKKYNKFHND